MYFWRYRLLAKALHQNLVTNYHYTIYMILFWLQVGVWGWTLTIPEMDTPINAFTNFIDRYCPLPWLLLTYSVNNTGDRKDYFRRIICLDLPLTVRVAVIFIPLSLVAGFLQSRLYIAQGMSPKAIDTAFAAGAPSMLLLDIASLICYFVFFVKALKIASGQMET